MPSHLIIGGISSGKSVFAETLAKGIYDDNANAGLYYIATAPILDDEMINKIEIHKKRRSKQWITIEEQIDICEKIRLIPEKNQIILIECITTWLSNMLFHESNLSSNIQILIDFIKSSEENHVILVSNDLGDSVISENKEVRFFQQLNGQINQQIAEVSDNVHKVIAGINIKIK
ncbi:MAG: hypothetical protein CML98_00255 [Rhodobiaceae bacterium]|nr:hypothetical protein [Rhodobiaceae bacterium]|tara:strand:- start:8325 stop:8849 length:525 start_codon:yes stop_codon:yes gene_type:complete